MITKITKKQQEEVDKLLDDALDFYLKKFNKKEIEEAVEEIYKNIGEKKPIIIYGQSPMSCILMCSMFGQLSDQLDGQLGGQLSNQLDSQLYSQLYSQISGQLYSQFSNQLDGQLRGQLGDQLYGQLDSQLRGQLEKIKSNYYISIFWYYWLKLYQIGKICGVKYDEEKYNLFKKFNNNISFFIPYKNVIFISVKPINVSFNTNKVLHNDKKAAIEYSDGYGVYALNGIRFPKEMAEKLFKKEMSFEEILRIVDVDQRNQALRFVGDKERDKFLEHTKAVVVEERKKLSPKGKIVYYRLYEIPKGDIFANNVKVMWYTCPSTGMSNFSGVPYEMKTVAEAMAWKGSNDFSQITAEDWENCQPLVDES